jgi:hypothetical protein
MWLVKQGLFIYCATQPFTGCSPQIVTFVSRYPFHTLASSLITYQSEEARAYNCLASTNSLLAASLSIAVGAKQRGKG